MWPQIANTIGADNWLLDGYCGRTSEQGYSSLIKCLQYGKPKIILWCLGMNDGDSSSAISTDWKKVADSLISLCEERGITLIFSTIPNVPNINHKYKNDYIKESGYRYVDVCEAVGADSGTSWYTGLLGSDNIHPSYKGRQVIAYRVISDVPEIMGE